MKAIVYHDQNPSFGMRPMPKFPEGFKPVAELEIDSDDHIEVLEEVFRLTNHIDTNWTTNPEIVKLYSNDPCRSTSVGDVVKLEDGSTWYCDTVGWKRI